MLLTVKNAWEPQRNWRQIGDRDQTQSHKDQKGYDRLKYVDDRFFSHPAGNKQVKKGKVDLKNNRYVANYIENDSTDIDNDALILSDDDSYTLSDDDDLTINLLNN